MTQMSNADATSTIATHSSTFRNQLVLVAGGASVLVGVSVLYGWAVSVEALKSVLPGLATMKPNTALAFILAGVGLITRRRAVVTQWPAVIGCICSAIVGSTGLLTLLEYGIHRNLGIDELLFRDPAGILTGQPPGRMAGATALVFVFLGGALFASHLRRDKTAQALASVAAFISFLACTGYLYGIAALYGIAPYSSMAIHTAATALLLCVGVLAVSSQSGPAALFGSIGPAGIISRRLVAVATILPLVLGWLVLTGCRSGLYASEFGLALFTLSIIVVLNSVILWTTGQLRRESDDRNAAEQKLRQSEERFRLVVELAPNGMVMIDQTGRIVLVNALAEKLFGYDRQEMLGQPIEILVPERFSARHPASRDRFFHSPAARSMGEGRDLFGRRKDGSEFPVEIGLNPIWTEHGLLILSAIVDITERKQVEVALRHSEKRMSAFFDNSAVIAWIKDTEGRHVYLSRNCETRFGARSKDWHGTTDFEFWPTRVAEKFRENDLLVLKENRSLEVIEEAQNADGTLSWWLVYKFPYQDTSGKRFVGGLGVDITERKLAEQALRESEERFRVAQQVARIGTFEWNIQTGVNRWTPELEAMYGLPPGGFTGTQQAWENLVHPEDRAEVVQRVHQAMESGGFDSEWRIVWPDGTLHWIAGRAWVFKDDSGKPLRLLGINIDITERKQAEQALRENERRFVEQTMAAREDEQRRIARDLHDGVGQSLTSLRLGLRVVEDATTLEEASSAAYKLRSIVVNAQDEVRRLTRNLRPCVLDDLGLGPALARIADDCMQAHGIQVSLDLSNLATPRLPEAMETALFRIAQEALTNVVKHAQATAVEMVIDRTPNAVDMSISDNGVGLKQSPKDERTRPHFGLMGIRERAALLKGKVQIHTPPRGGVAIQVTIPHSETVSA